MSCFLVKTSVPSVNPDSTWVGVKCMLAVGGLRKDRGVTPEAKPP